MSNNFTRYQEFLNGVTSEPSQNNAAYIERLNELDQQGIDIARLDTALTGLNSESGEALDILKKVKFQGKPFNQEVKDQLVSEAGDVLFYWTQLCMALGVDPYAVMQANVDKLSARYPGGVFSVDASENRDGVTVRTTAARLQAEAEAIMQGYSGYANHTGTQNTVRNHLIQLLRNFRRDGLIEDFMVRCDGSNNQQGEVIVAEVSYREVGKTGSKLFRLETLPA